MKFVTVRELRSKTATLRKDLDQDREIVLTANGRPFAVVSRIEPDSLEEELQAIRRARAKVAVERLRAQAQAKGLNRLTMDDIDAMVAETRRRRRVNR
ncbi:MAG TPA: type II toxin-antitoxin system Phd/YefM family antitoxin [Candidatus Methylomirabilis sp.]|nr:type II toxin-antitoxin system Phd/YefM family antitoxin [Candidatus Methylomirabilis sp.]